MGIRLSERNALTRGKASFPYTRGKPVAERKRKGVASSGGAGITSPLRRLPPRPTLPPSPFPSSLPAPYPPPCLAFSLAGWLFVCLGSLACRCVVCLCVSSSSCSVGVVVLFSGLFSLCPVSWFSVFLLSFCVYVHVSMSMCLCSWFLGCVSCWCCILSLWCLFYLCVCCVWCLCLWLVRVCCVLIVLPCLCVLLVLCLLLIVCYLLVYCLLSFCVLSVVCCRCCFR